MINIFRIEVSLLLLTRLCVTSYTTKVPVVLWHGMGDSCCFSYSLGKVKSVLEENIPGVYVKSIRIGTNNIEDVENSFFKSVNEQIEQVCQELSMDEKLKHGYNAIGFSQGAQFLRAVAQKCGGPQMQNLISLGGQHQGVYGLPNCASIKHYFCDMIRRMLHYAAYTKYVQNNLVQAQFWHDPNREEEYRKRSTFLSDINNELQINETYKRNLKKLKNLVLVKFDHDQMVQPAISEWFGFYKPGQAVEIETLHNSKLYIEDRLGLKEMDANGKLHFISLDSKHLQFDIEWFIEAIINKFLV
ncbi:PREDICTED: palmitoyl-protein thioesterase 1 [Ceratosolen solmsi marchali]|uniref:Palmitoyl-protein thioesterase 1 n=1 Tax=Ceratosolen solmsi marchali TaxID=326594 RepID=A0AAJ6YQ92_9HYME|nr:PREDICTED: palmitoyl-protein thioesterase 1 [Ceratosolen solmsi marchali]